MAKQSENVSISLVAEETKYDARLLDKRVEHGFLTREEKDAHIKNLPAETEYDFTSAEELDAEDV